MAFSRVWPLGLTNGVSRLLAAALNQLDINQSRGVDGTAGGTYTPSAPVVFNGSGFGGNQSATTLSSTYTFGTAGRMVLTPQSVVLTGSNKTIRDVDAGAAGSLYLVDDSAAAAQRTITIKASMAASAVHGEYVRLSFVDASTHGVPVASEGGGSNPIYTSDGTPGLGPDWVDLMFDTSITGSNPDGEWIVIAHGRVGAS